MDIRIGQGIDFHQLAEGEDLVIGGIQIPHHKGSVGHSDADVLLHVICDALLGAIAQGDIGAHFPDTDPQYKGIDSKILLRETYNIVKQEGYQLLNIDSTVCLQTPKLRPYILAMRESIAQVLEFDIDAISIKATTTEKMGYVGREEGIEAHAVVLIAKK